MEIKGSLLLGSTKDFASDTLGFAKMIHKEYGGFAKAKIAFRDFYFVSQPDLVVEVLQQNNKAFKKSFAYDGLAAFLGSGLLTAEGEKWRENRRKIQPEFSHKNYGQWAQEMLTELEKGVESLKGGGELPVISSFRKLSADVVMRVLFGEEAGRSSRDISHLLDGLRGYANDKMKNPFMLPLTFPTKVNQTFKKNLKQLNAVIEEVIDSRISSGEQKGDLLSLLINAHEELGDVNRKQVRDELVTLYIAGQETTASSMALGLRLLNEHPKFTDHLRSVLKDKEGTVDLFKCEELMNFVHELLRIYPPAWAISREVKENVELGGRILKKGSTVFVPIYTMHHDPQLWEEPELFNPERFKTFDRKSKHYMPFGFGPRMCIGNHFALLELALFFHTFLSKVKHFEIIDKDDFQLVTPMTMGPKNEFFLTIIE